MKSFISIFLVIGSVLIFFGCEHDNLTDPELNQSNQVVNSLAKKAAPSLQCTIAYVFAGHLGIPPDPEGRNLIWDGEIHGDIEGRIWVL